MIRDAADAVDVYLDCMQSSTLQSVQSLVSISHANSDSASSGYRLYSRCRSSSSKSKSSNIRNSGSNIWNYGRGSRMTRRGRSWVVAARTVASSLDGSGQSSWSSSWSSSYGSSYINRHGNRYG